MNFLQLQVEYFQTFGEVNPADGSIRATPAALVSAKRHINMAYRKVVAEHDWPVLRDEERVRMRVPYTTGTVTVVTGSAAVTGAGTTWTKAMENQRITINGEEHRIHEVLTGTTLTLKHEVIQTGAGALAYNIEFDVYKMPRRLLKIYAPRNPDVPIALRTANPMRENRGRLLYEDTAGLVDTLDYDFLSTDVDFLNTGTASINQGATTVTLAGGAPAINAGIYVGSIERGAIFRIPGDDVDYYIDNVSGAATFDILSPYRGANVVAGAYVIDPAGLRLFRLIDIPDTAAYLIFEGKKKVSPMVLDTDTPHPIPEEYHETVLLKGGLVEGLKRRRLPAKDMEADFAQSLASMKSGIQANATQWGARMRRMAQKGTPVAGRILSSDQVSF
jgi:hypothetical protein